MAQTHPMLTDILAANYLVVQTHPKLWEILATLYLTAQSDTKLWEILTTLYLMAQADTRMWEMTAKLCLSWWLRQTPDRQKVSYVVLVMMAQTDPRLTEMSATLYLSSWHRQIPDWQKCQPYCICLHGTYRPHSHRNVSHIVFVFVAHTDPTVTEMSAILYLSSWHRQTPESQKCQPYCICLHGTDRSQSHRNVSHTVFVFMAQTDPRVTEMSAILYLSSWHRQTPESQKCQPYCICLRSTDRPRTDRNVVRSGRDSDCVRMTVHGYLIIKRLEMSSCLFHLLFPKYWRDFIWYVSVICWQYGS